MMIRIVRMSFDPNKVNEFLRVFDTSKEKIRAFDGCQYLSLNKDHTRANVYYTLSHWQSTQHLEAYRESELFKTTWAAVKPMFNEMPQAFSLEKEIEL